MRGCHAWRWLGLLCLGLFPVHTVNADTGQENLSLYFVVWTVLLVLIALVLWTRLGRHHRAPYAYLYCVSGGSHLKRYGVLTEVTRIGRHPNNEVQIPNKSISRFHAELVRHRNGTFSIYDVNSTNGTRVGSRPVRSSFLRDGDMIDLGNVRFKFTRLPRDYKLHQHTQVLNIPSSRFDRRRRLGTREDTRTQVRLYNDDTGWINGWMRNTGREGAFIETDTRLASRLPVDVVAAVVEGTRRRWLRVSAEVVWSDSKGLGIRFTDGDPDTVDELVGMANAPGTSASPTLH